MSIAILDVEIILHRAISVAVYEFEWAPDEWTYNVRLGEAKAHILSDIDKVRATAPTHDLALALSDSYSFRYFVWPGYKSNRRDRRKAAGFGALKAWLVAAGDTHGWKILRLPQVEADDVMGLYAGNGDLIVSGDKDLRTVPALHLDPDTGEIEEVTTAAANLLFWKQTLTGDTSDGYPGCPGMGEASANKLLSGLDPGDTSAAWEAIVGAYEKKNLTERDALVQARCARILRPGEYDTERMIPKLWKPPLRLASAAVQ